MKAEKSSYSRRLERKTCAVFVFFFILNFHYSLYEKVKKIKNKKIMMMMMREYRFFKTIKQVQRIGIQFFKVQVTGMIFDQKVR